MKIWLLNKKTNKTWKWAKRILEEAKKAKVNLKFIAIEDIELIIWNKWKEEIFYKNKPCKLPDVVIARNDVSYQMRSIMDFLEGQWVNMINDSASRFLAKDKFLSLQKLASNSIPVPKTILLKWIPNIEFIEEQLNYPIILKKIEGSHWKWIIKVNNREDLEDIIEMLSDSLSMLNKNVILQEFIWEKVWQDLRLFIIWWRIAWAMLRKWKAWDFKSNYSGWGDVFIHKPTEQEEIIALNAANIIWLDIAWIDILFDKNNGYKICEVNASPWFEWLEKATWLNIAWEIVSYITKRYGIN